MSYPQRPVALLRVVGRSMSPTLADGDLLLARRVRRPRPGAVVVVRLPHDADGAPRPLGVKRLAGRDPDDPTRWWVERDNPREGTDSWLFGSLAPDDVLGEVVARIWPRPGLVGRLPGG